MRHTARSWWLDEAGAVTDVRPRLNADVLADVVVVGGGYTGMWAAWHVLEREPDARVVLLEADMCGHGPSGRNGGFLEDLWLSLPSLRRRFGDEGALAVARASEESVEQIEAWCRDNDVDAWFRRGGQLVVSTTPAHDGREDGAVAAAAHLGAGDKVVPLTAEEIRARCASPAFRDGVFLPTGATVQPARLALGLRRRLLERGVEIFERTRVQGASAGGVRTPGASAHARRGVVLAAGGGLAALPPLRARLTVASSHIVLTEPVPDVIEELGWTGGESITDARRLLHYTRTTADGRIVFGWAGGRLALGARLGGRVEVDPAVAAQARVDLVAMFPALEGRAVTHAWGGPIDISPAHLPAIGSLGPRGAHYAFGYTGNGVGPSHLAGRILAELALGTGDPLTRLPLVNAESDRPIPPEPLRWLGGTAVLEAVRRKEAAELRGERAGLVVRAAAALPERLGITLGR